MAFCDFLSVQRTSSHSSPQLRHIGALASRFGAGLGAAAALAWDALGSTLCAAVAAGLISGEN
ncbi:MAG: hypothetical protein MUP49_05790, partial [Dehalococcoidia bacterium]|nr:hypothetical protein [Dehalococcoidia bacterium]